MALPGQKYKIRLESGRILGPLDSERILNLIRKNRILGSESAREYPRGEWKNISQIPELAEMLLSSASNALAEDQAAISAKPQGYQLNLQQGVQVQGATVLLDDDIQGPAEQEGGDASPQSSGPPSGPIELAVTGAEVGERQSSGDLRMIDLRLDKSGAAEAPAEDDASDATQMNLAAGDPSEGDDRTMLSRLGDIERPETPESGFDVASRGVSIENLPIRVEPMEQVALRSIANEATVVFQRSSPAPGSAQGSRLRGKKKNSPAEIVKIAVIAIALGTIGYQEFLQDPPKRDAVDIIRASPIRAEMPAFNNSPPDPALSAKLYKAAINEYWKDTIPGYREAIKLFLRAAILDANNPKILGMLASCYLNVIDSSNKDENYFTVISRLIEMAKAKNVDLVETVIPEVEFYIAANKAEAAQNLIVEFTKTHQYDLPLVYLLALTFYQRDDYQNALKFLNKIPDDKVFSPKVFYLKGMIAEKLDMKEDALAEFGAAVKRNKSHARSRLQIALIWNEKGSLRSATDQLDFIAKDPYLLSAPELARAYFLYSQLQTINNKPDQALGYIERAVKLDKHNHDYLFELYTLRAREGEVNKDVKRQAKMYAILSEGEALLKDGKSQEAFAKFMEARNADISSTVPLVRLGDMFLRRNDVRNAELNYKLASEKDGKNIDIGSKYIYTLIQSYEWEEAQKQMDKFRKLPVSQSAVDKAAGDMYARQGRHPEAQTYYKKSMARESIDPDVYISYAKSLIALKQYREAPFFFALAKRFDPLSLDAVIGTAQCVAATDGIERGISYLQDQLQKMTGSKAELLSAVAEMQIQRGEWGLAQQFVDQAILANPDYAYPWKIQAEIYMNRESREKGMLDKALDAYKSFSDRNVSDPSGYLERFRIFVKKAEFDKATVELTKIYELYPKYPNLHFYKGSLYAVEGNHKAAIDEYQQELKNNPQGVDSLVGLGKEYVEIGQIQDALGEFSKAMLLAPNAAEPKHQAGYANYLLKNYDGSIALLNAALDYDKGNPLIYKRLGMAYRDRGDLSGAKTAFRKYLEMDPNAPDKAEFERYL